MILEIQFPKNAAATDSKRSVADMIQPENEIPQSAVTSRARYA
jgi:hypothetical protein